MFLEDLQQNFVPVPRILLTTAEHVVFLPVIDQVEARYCFTGTTTTISSDISERKLHVSQVR